MPTSRDQHLQQIATDPVFAAAVGKLEGEIEQRRQLAVERHEKTFGVPLGDLPARVYNHVAGNWREAGWTVSITRWRNEGSMNFS